MGWGDSHIRAGLIRRGDSPEYHFLDVVFVASFDMGVAGVALATVDRSGGFGGPVYVEAAPHEGYF